MEPIVSEKRIYTLNRKYNYNIKQVIRALKDNEEIINEIPKEQYVTFMNPLYPCRLLNLYSPPTCLFYEGDLSLLKRKCIGIIGSRQNSEYGRLMTQEMMKYIPKEYVIVSGLAKGIDGIAHKEAIQSGHKTIGVIGSGLKYIYPRENENLIKEMKKNHIVISEYFFEESVRPNHFLERNRIIAGLSDILIVIESQIHSGTSTTVKEMIALGKEVYVLPHNITNTNADGNLKLLDEGANLLWNFNEFNELLKNHLTKS